MKRATFVAVCGAIAALQACGSSGSSATQGTSSSGSTSSGSTSSSGSSSSTSSSSSAGSSSSSGGSSSTSSTSTSSGASSSSSSSSSGGAACPDELGAYTVTDAGQGCGDLDLTAQECIKATPNECVYLLVSRAGITGSGVDGTVTVDAAGDFASGAVKLGSLQRSGCVGTWNAATSQLGVDCGGPNPSTQMCTATLTRTSMTCGF